MTEFENDPLLVTYVIEESYGPNGEWYSLEEAAELSGLLSALWTIRKIHEYPPEFDEWISSGYRKHLRRAKPADFEKLIAAEPGHVVQGEHGRLYASNIHRKSETSKLVSRLQLSGFKPQEKGREPFASMVKVILNQELSMSFGKAVIASAHAVQLMTLRQLSEDQELLNAWAEDDYFLRAVVAPVPDDESNYVKVVDHGLTEVASGSVTAAIHLSR